MFGRHVDRAHYELRIPMIGLSGSKANEVCVELRPESSLSQVL